METKQDRELILEVGDGDIKLLRDALIGVYTSKSGLSRTIAALKFGGRHQWALIVKMWEDALAEAQPQRPGYTMVMLHVYNDGSAKCTFVDAEGNP